MPLDPPPEDVPPGVYRHFREAEPYEVLGVAQDANADTLGSGVVAVREPGGREYAQVRPLFERSVVVYRDTTTGALFVRSVEDFRAWVAVPADQALAPTVEVFVGDDVVFARRFSLELRF